MVWVGGTAGGGSTLRESQLHWQPQVQPAALVLNWAGRLRAGTAPRRMPPQPPPPPYAAIAAPATAVGRRHHHYAAATPTTPAPTGGAHSRTAPSLRPLVHTSRRSPPSSTFNTLCRPPPPLARTNLYRLRRWRQSVWGAAPTGQTARESGAHKAWGARWEGRTLHSWPRRKKQGEEGRARRSAGRVNADGGGARESTAKDALAAGEDEQRRAGEPGRGLVGGGLKAPLRRAMVAPSRTGEAVGGAQGHTPPVGIIP